MKIALIILEILSIVFMLISIFFNFSLLISKEEIKKNELFMFSSLYALGLTIMALILFTVF